MKPIAYFLILFITTICSCNICTSSIEVNSFKGYSISTYEDTVSRDTLSVRGGTYYHSLRLESNIESRKEGERKDLHCYKGKAYEVSYDEVLDTASLMIYANHDIYYDDEVFKKGGNLLDHPDVFEYNNSRDLTFRIDSLVSNTYTYYVSGKTSKGNSFIDSTTVYYE